MDLCVALEVVLADKTFAAMAASVLAIPKMSLDMASDVLATAKGLGLTAREKTCPSMSDRVLLGDVGCNFLGRYSCIFNGAFDVQVGD
jgi:hypothetical protein